MSIASTLGTPIAIDLLAAKRRQLARLWLGAISVSVLGSWIGMFAEPGINWGIWTVIAVAGFLVFARLGEKRIPADVFVALGLGCLLALGAGVTANPYFYPLILAGTVAMLSVAALRLGGKDLESAGAGFLAIAPFEAGLRATVEAGRSAAEGIETLRGERTMPILRGVVIATPIALLFALLLSGADPIFAQGRISVMDALAHFSFLPRLIFFVGLGVIVLGAYSMALRPVAVARDARDLAGPAAPRPSVMGIRLGVQERLIVLGTVGSLFGLFLALQVAYLFGDPAQIAGNGITYADHARHGFAELTIVATLCTLLLVSLDRYAEPGAHESRVRGGALVVILESQLLLQSAYHRISLYEQAYGYTTQRVYAQAYMIAGSLVLWLLAREVWDTIDIARLARRTAALGALALVSLIYWNHEAWIVRANVERYQKTGKIDAEYLTRGLSLDALPALVAARAQLPAAIGIDSLAGSRIRGHRSLATEHWYEWSVRREQGRAALEKLALR